MRQTLRIALGLMAAVSAITLARPECYDESRQVDYAVLSFNVGVPNNQGFATVEIEYELTVAGTSDVPATNLQVSRNTVPVLSIPLAEELAKGGCNSSGDGWSSNCGGVTCDGGCDANNGICDCRKSPSGQYSKCKCVSIHNQIFGLQASSGDVFNVALDVGGVILEENECNNTTQATLP